MDEKELKELKSLAVDKFKELEEKMVKGEDFEGMKADLEAANELAGKINDANDVLAENQKKMQDQLDANETKLKEFKEVNAKGKIVTPSQFFAEELKNSKEFEAFRSNPANSVKLSTDEKAMFDMIHKATILESSHWTGNVAPVDRISDVTWHAPHEPVRIRSLINFGTTQSNVVDFVRGTSTNNAASVVEGAEKAESEEDLAAVQATVQVLAHVFKISKQALEDYGQMATYLASEGIAGLKDVEDTQLLSGSGVSPNLDGIITQASTTFSGGAGTDTDLDTLLKAVYVLKALNYRPSAILIPYAKMRDIKLLKDDNDQYIFPNFLPLGLANPVSIDGVPVIEHGSMPSGTFLVGDFTKALGFDREIANVRFSEENEDNFVKNLISVRVEERLTLTVTRTDAFVSTTFYNAQHVYT